MDTKLSLLIRVGLSFILLVCLFGMPYGYYQFVRLATCAGFIWLAYCYSKNALLLLPCIGAALLFNPIIKVVFNRDTWHVIDLIIAGLLGIWVIVDLVSLRYVSRQKSPTE